MKIVSQVQAPDAFGKTAAQHIGAGKFLFLVRLNRYRQEKTALDEIEVIGDRTGLDEMANAHGDRLLGSGSLILKTISNKSPGCKTNSFFESTTSKSGDLDKSSLSGILTPAAQFKKLAIRQLL